MLRGWARSSTWANAATPAIRILVQEGIGDAFIAWLTEFAGELNVRDPLDETAKLGAIINDTQEQKIFGYTQAGKEAGATICMGGGKKETEKGRFLEVTILNRSGGLINCHGGGIRPGTLHHSFPDNHAGGALRPGTV